MEAKDAVNEESKKIGQFFFCYRYQQVAQVRERLRERLRRGQGKVKEKARSKGLVYSTVLNTPSAAISVYMKRPAKHWLRIL
jgi:hypothetical protein